MIRATIIWIVLGLLATAGSNAECIGADCQSSPCPRSGVSLGDTPGAAAANADSCKRLLTGNPYGIAGYISSANLQGHGFPPGLHTYDWNSLRTDLKYQMVRPLHYIYRYMVPGGNYVQAWSTYDAANQPEAWFTQQSYPTDTPWNIRQGLNLILRRPWGYLLDRTGGNIVGQIGLPPEWLPQWYVNQGGNHQQRFDAWVTANPGRIWLLGNEPGCFELVSQLKGQDALTDAEYAVFYRTYHAHITALDPTAVFANAALAMTTSPTWSPELPVESVIGIWQRVLNLYADRYGAHMPVDIWNIHLYAGHGAGEPNGHRAKYVQTIEAFRTFVDSARGGVYRDAPMILTEFNGTYDAAGFTRENVVSFLRDFREDLNNLWVRGVLDQWFWFVSSGGTEWPAVSIRDGANLTIVGEEYKTAAWYWEALKPPIHQRYGTGGQPFHSARNGGLWSLVTWSDDQDAENTLSIAESFADRARITVNPGSGTAGEMTLAEDRHLAGLGTFSFLAGQGAAVQISFAAANSADTDLYLGYKYGRGGPTDGQSGVVLRAEGGDSANTTVLDAFDGHRLASGVNFTHRHKVFFVVNNNEEMVVYLDNTAAPLGTLARMSLPDCNANQLRIGSNSAQVSGHGRFRGNVDVFAFALDNNILQVDIAPSPPILVDARLNAGRLLANDIATYSVSITALDYDGVDQMRDVRAILNRDAPLSTENARGYLAWGATDDEIIHFAGQWTMVGDADGGGRWAWRADGWGGDTYLTPLGAATVVSGNQRTVTFSFRAKPTWGPAQQQRLYVSSRDASIAAPDWQLALDRFAVLKLDYDSDGDVDQTDYGQFQRCFSGPGILQKDPECAHALLDNDDDVDMDDFALFQGCMSGAGGFANPNCAE